MTWLKKNAFLLVILLGSCKYLSIHPLKIQTSILCTLTITLSWHLEWMKCHLQARLQLLSQPDSSPFDALTCCSESSGMYCRVLNWMWTDVSEIRAGSIIALVMEASRTSETSVDIQLRTRQYIPEDSELHTCRRENLKTRSYLLYGYKKCWPITLGP
jgi:hypothetical protein